MGAEQSSVHEDDLYPSNYGELNEDQPSSLPSSPNRTAPPISCNRTAHTGSLIPQLRSTSNPMLHQFSSNTVISTSVYGASSLTRPPKRSLSVAVEHPANAGGIITVCPGPSMRHRCSSTSDVRSGSGDAKLQQLQRLKQIPQFYPLHDPGRFVPTGDHLKKRFNPHIHSMDVDKFAKAAKSYREHVMECTNTIHTDQTRIIGLFNKVDYELNLLHRHLKAREKGVLSSHQKQSLQKSPPVIKPNLAGSKQVDDFVLQTSQVSSLLGQSSIRLGQICDALNSLNKQLPLSKQLPPLKLDVVCHP